MQLKIQGRGYLNNNKDDAMKAIRQSSYLKSNQDEQVVIIMKHRAIIKLFWLLFFARVYEQCNFYRIYEYYEYHIN